MPTLLEYLTRPNLEVDRTNLQSGPNSFSIGDYEVEGVQAWTDFILENALDCFGDILCDDIPNEELHLPAPVSPHHRNLMDESSMGAILKKYNHVIVDRSLQVAQSRLEGRGLHLPISWSWGSLSHIEEDPRLRPDWAGTIHSGSPPYENRVPGDTKQSKKWRSTMKDSASSSDQEEYWKPLRQVLLYCVRVNSRYGYIITGAEALFSRRTKSPDLKAFRIWLRCRIAFAIP